MPSRATPEKRSHKLKRLALFVAFAGLLAGCSAAAPSGNPASTTSAPVTVAPIATLPALSGTAAVLDEARKFVFRVRNSPCLATGTAFAYDGTIVTNRHVAAGATALDLATWAGSDFQARVTGNSPTADLARLAADLPAGTTTPASGGGPDGVTEPAVGSHVYLAGYPEGDQLTAVSGAVVGVTTDPSSGVTGPIIEVSDRVQPGNSGSPLLDAQGRVVGVVFAFDTTSGDGLAMPLSTLSAFLAGPVDPAALPCAP